MAIYGKIKNVFIWIFARVDGRGFEMLYYPNGIKFWMPFVRLLFSRRLFYLR